MLIEPTESESLRELDRFCDAMIAIRKEADAIASGEQPRDGNILRRAPHPITSVVSDTWDRPYSREAAAYPDSRLRRNKMWPSTSRIDDAWGDRKCVRARRTVRLTCAAWSASARPSRSLPSPEPIHIARSTRSRSLSLALQRHRSGSSRHATSTVIIIHPCTRRPQRLLHMRYTLDQYGFAPCLSPSGMFALGGFSLRAMVSARSGKRDRRTSSAGH